MMKNLLLLGLAFTAGVGVTNAQKARIRPTNMVAVPVENKLDGDAYFSGNRTPQSPSKSKGTHKVQAAGLFGTQIGKTYYDLPSNAAVANRIVRNSDGTISATWTETCAPSASTGFPNRGSGYNYFNGTTWTLGAIAGTNPVEYQGTCPDNFGINTKRVGWPEMVVLGNGSEGVLTHTTSDGINWTVRPAKGTGGLAAFTSTDLAFSKNVNAATGVNGTWPRAVVGGLNGNTIHMIYCLNKTVATGSPSEPTISGVQNPFVYSRSTDGGVTWDKQNIAFPDLIGANGYDRIGGDGYAIAAKGNTVAIVAGNFGQPWTLWKSTDNGSTWTKKFIKQYSTAADTIMTSPTDTLAITNDAAHAVVIDNNDNVHVWAGEIYIRCTVNAAGHVIPQNSWYPGVGRRLYYWNDTKTPGDIEVIADVEDSHTTGDPADWVASDTNHRTPYGTIGSVSMANGAVHSSTSGSGDVYVVYSGVVEGTTNGSGQQGQPLRDLYIMKRPATGTYAGLWSNPINISRSKNLFPGTPSNISSAADNGEENVFPSVSHIIGTDNKLHTTWMSDYEPGMNLGADVDPEDQNAIMYEGFNVNSFAFAFVTGLSKDVAAYVNNINAFPNPTNGKVTISIDLKKSANVKVRVTNVMGQEVAAFAPKAMAAGQATVDVDLNNLASGVYLYTVSSDEFTTTNRIVKQ